MSALRIVPAGDSGALADRLTALLADPERRRALGDTGRARALTEFSVGRMTERTLEVYDEALR